MSTVRRLLAYPIDLLVTFGMWVYFTVGFVCFWFPIYLFSVLIPGDRVARTQRVNSWFFRVFFRLMAGLAPGLRFRIPDEVRQMRGALVICNHLSYLDPILLVSLFARQATIVKPVWFKVPIFGWLLHLAGYIAPAGNDRHSVRMMNRLARLEHFLEGGGVLFVFPEGTRRRDGTIGEFQTGAFKIARRAGAPIELLLLRGTNELYPPGAARLRTCRGITVSVERLGRLEPEEVRRDSVSELAKQLRQRYQKELSGRGNAGLIEGTLP
ncbi:MAG: lysophospholipid acyltransferase family protein [bacterium]